MTQLSNVLITDNSTIKTNYWWSKHSIIVSFLRQMYGLRFKYHDDLISDCCGHNSPYAGRNRQLCKPWVIQPFPDHPIWLPGWRKVWKSGWASSNAARLLFCQNLGRGTYTPASAIPAVINGSLKASYDLHIFFWISRIRSLHCQYWFLGWH